MSSRTFRLINGEHLEALPAVLARPRGNATARALAGTDWLIRRKADGRFLATRRGDVVTELLRGALAGQRRDDLLRLPTALAAGEAPRPLTGLLARLHELGLDEGEYAVRTGLALVPEPHVLTGAGHDRYDRPLWLTDGAARAWLGLVGSARADGVVLEAISGYRSHDYQLGIFRRKRARGLSVEQILEVNAAPGFSEHHGGNVLDISTPGEPAAEETFEATAAFRWLRDHAATHGFVMSYPRGNPHGIVYEPWHWRWDGAQ